MNKDKISQSLIYDELGLSPLWILTKNHTQSISELETSKEASIYLKRIKSHGHNILFIAPIFDISDDIELELLKKISNYLDTLCDNSNDLKPLEQIKENALSSRLGNSEYVVILDQNSENPINIENSTIPTLSSPSLKEMVEKPEKKKKLWQDIKELLKSINK
jgi:hypothetical protein